jgi:hypothetical protein
MLALEWKQASENLCAGVLLKVGWKKPQLIGQQIFKTMSV